MDHPPKHTESEKKTSGKLPDPSSVDASLFTFFRYLKKNVKRLKRNLRKATEQTALWVFYIVSKIFRYFYVRYRRYGAWRIILCLLFISLTSYVLVAHILDSLALLSREQLTGTVIRRLDDRVIIIDENRNETISIINKVGYPVILDEHFRYNNEDVRFRCFDFMDFESEVEPDSKQIIWKHNGEDIIPSWRYNINSTFREVNNKPLVTTILYVFDSTLTIYLIEDRDFGNYSCHIRGTAKRKLKNYDAEERATQDESKYESMVTGEGPLCSSLLKFILLLDPYMLVGEYKLSKIPSTIINESAPPGGIVSLTASYINEAEKQDISVGYFINNKPYHDVCSGRLSVCSLFVFMYWRYWHPEGNSDGISNLDVYWQRNKNSVLAKAWQCACPSTYGIHSFKFYRNVYNVSSGRHVVVEVDYPTRIRLIPRTADVLRIFQNDSKPQQFGEECLDSIPCSCSSLQCVINELIRNYLIIEYTVFYICLCLAMFIAYKLIIHCITPVKNLILGEGDSESLTESKCQKALEDFGNNLAD